MNGADPLAQLAPLRAPAGIGWWPPAPGWWLLCGLLLLCLIGAIYMWRRHAARQRYRRRALRQLRALKQQRAALPPAQYIQDINALLKAVALHAYAPQRVASLHGDNWARFLCDHADIDPANASKVANGGYAPNPPDSTQDIEQLAERWIRQHRSAT